MKTLPVDISTRSKTRDIPERKARHEIRLIHPMFNVHNGLRVTTVREACARARACVCMCFGRRRLHFLSNNKF